MSNCIVNFTPTGMIPTKEMTPYVPIEPNEIVEQVLELSQDGLITMTHIHARDEHGIPTLNPNIYANIVSGIRKYDRDLIICVSLSGRYESDPKCRALPLTLDGDMKPDMGSLTLSSLNFNKQASVNSPDTIKYLAEKMLEANIKPELEVFDMGMMNYARYLIGKGNIVSPYYFNFILGNVACMQVDPLHIGILLKEIPSNNGVQNSYWSIGGIGNYQFEANVASLLFGSDSCSGVRIGIEDNIYMDKERTQLATNRQLVERIVEMGDRLGRKVMSPLEARLKLGMTK